MRFCKSYQFDPGIEAYKLGWSLVGPPMMTVFIFSVDGVLFDTGLPHMGPQVESLVREKGIHTVFLTHHHEDHAGNAGRISRIPGVRIFGHGLTREKMVDPAPILPYQKYVWGSSSPARVSPLPGKWENHLGPLSAVHTPGHAKDHMVYHFPDHGLLISGDLFLAQRIKFFRSDERVGEQIASLKRALELDFDTLLCSHYPRQTGGRKALAGKLAFLEDFQGRILALHGKGMGEKAIFKAMDLREDRFIRAFTFGNVSLMNGVRSVIRDAGN